MKHPLLLLSALAMLACSLLAVDARAAVAPQGALPGPGLHRCVAPAADQAVVPFTAVDHARWAREFAAEKMVVDIPVAVHVLYSRKGKVVTGEVTDDQIYQQVALLNTACSGSGIMFHLVSIDRTNNKVWAAMQPSSSAEEKAKEALAVDPAHTLNIYTIAPKEGVLGWAYYPWTYPEDDFMHGIVVHYGSLPEGDLYPYDEGDTAVHMFGHYLALFHTFNGGCTEPNDLCDDTPQHQSATYGCPEGLDTCPNDPGLDPIHNFMNFTDDGCMYEFTSCQFGRMEWAIYTYKPSLLTAKTDQVDPGTPLAGRTGIIGINPNPFNPATMVHYRLNEAGAVSLRIYDVAGRLVHTLVEGIMPAGDHRVPFTGEGLPSSVYFVVCQTDQGRDTRRVLLLK